MENLKEMKTWLKENGKAIRALKIEMKNCMRTDIGSAWRLQNKLEDDKRAYRHNHIAYSMARGKTYDQIEAKTPRASDLNWNQINIIIENISPEKEEI